jgi:hypothetical protein
MEMQIRLRSKQTQPLNMKALFLMISGLSIASLVKENLFPNAHLTILLGIVVSLDFFSGLLKSVATNTPIISKKLQRTSLKICRYGLTIIVCYVLRSLAETAGPVWKIIGDWLNDGLLILLIYTETVSVLENIIAINADDLFSREIAKPLHAFLTLKFNNGLTTMFYKKYDEDKNKKP